MNLTKIQIKSPGSKAGTQITHFTFALTEQDRSSPYILKRVTGLEPGELIKTYNDGPKFFRTRPKERIVSFQLKLNPNYAGDETMGDLRDKLYLMIAYNGKASTWNSDTKLQIRFLNGNEYIASLFGYMVHIEADVFSNSSDVIFTIECDDPFLRAFDLNDISENIQPTSTASHEYINGVTYNVESAFHCLDTKSTAPHGFRMVAECISDIPSSESEPPKFIIWDNRNPLVYIFSAFAEACDVGDKVYISTEEYSRYFYINHYELGVYTDTTFMLKNIYWGSIWPMISPGDNFIEVSEGFKILEVKHRESYWGI